MSRFDPEEAMRRGSVAAWPDWAPELLPAGEIHAGCAEALERRGERGFPEVVSLYTHFPYCKSTCSFCQFWHQVPRSESDYGTYVEYLVRLMGSMRPGMSTASPVTTAYCGGGTPSATPLAGLRRYFDSFTKNFQVTGEFTFEGHPAHIDEDKISLLADSGVNRLSMGIQSFDPELLKAVTRKNRPYAEIAAIVEETLRRGLEVNLDLVLGLPGQTPASFRSDLLQTVKLGPSIVTVYIYQPVMRHPEPPPDHMGYQRVVTPELLEQLASAGYDPDMPVEHARVAWHLLARDKKNTFPNVYGAFDNSRPFQLIGLGPGSYSHLYGVGCFRNVTAMSAIDIQREVYWGTRLSAEDEVRQFILRWLDMGRLPLELPALESLSGVDIRKVLGETIQHAIENGVVSPDSDSESNILHVNPDASSEMRDLFIKGLMPSKRESTTSPDAATREFIQPELVQLRQSAKKEGAGEKRVKEFREILGVPDVGRRFLGAIVRTYDAWSVSFGVEQAPHAPIRVHVRPKGQGRTYVTVGEFGLVIQCEDMNKLTLKEQKFIDELIEALRKALATPSHDEPRCGS